MSLARYLSKLGAMLGSDGKVPASGLAAGAKVGTASQSSGVPTGAIIERGSNGNGEYVRYADGTQICWKRVSFSGQSLIANNAGVALNVTPAAEFLNATVSYSFSGALYDANGYACYGYFVTYDDGSTRAILSNTGNRPTNVHPTWNSVGGYTATNGHYTVMAVGRWY